MFNDTFKILLIEANNYLKICWFQSTIVRNIVVSIQQKTLSLSALWQEREHYIFQSICFTVPGQARGHTGGIALWQPGQVPTGCGCHR